MEIRQVKLIQKTDNNGNIIHQSTVEPEKENEKKKKKVDLSLILLVLGVLVLMYPVLMYVIKNSMKIYDVRTAETILAQSAANAEYLKAVEEYNKSLNDGSFQSKEFNNSKANVFLGNEKPLSILKIPSLNQELLVYYGATDKHLRKDVAILENTSLPFGGSNTHAVITGHRGVSDADIFLHLDKVKPGDHIYIENGKSALAYRAVRSKVVEPNAVNATTLEKDRDLVTLLTCTPVMINSHRLLVTFERDPDEEARYNHVLSLRTGDVQTDELVPRIPAPPKPEDFYEIEGPLGWFDSLKITILTWVQRAVAFLRMQNLYMLLTPPFILLILLVFFRKPKKKKTDIKNS